MKTILIDIDGTLLRHQGDLTAQMTDVIPALPGAVAKLNEWNRKGYCIVLVTGRKESMREITRIQLQKAGLFFDQLIMGLPRGQRVLINDNKPDMDETAVAVTVQRNIGIEDISV